MTTEMQKQAAWVSEIYAAVAKGGTLQVWHSDTEEWRDASNGPNLTCREDWWRIKPKPRTFWIRIQKDGEVIDVTQHQPRLDRWRKDGYTVIETMEVLP